MACAKMWKPDFVEVKYQKWVSQGTFLLLGVKASLFWKMWPAVQRFAVLPHPDLRFPLYDCETRPILIASEEVPLVQQRIRTQSLT